MSKAILIMDMPKNCAECSLCGTQDGEYFCIPDDFAHYLGDSYVNRFCENKPEWCPLKPIPEKTIPFPIDDEEQKQFCKGWNACIDEILKP